MDRFGFDVKSERETFLHYVRPRWRRLHLAARQYVVCEEEAHDLVQEALLRAWRRFSVVEEKTHSPSWLFVILRHVAIDWRRTANRRIKLTPILDSELTDLAASDPTEPFCPFPTMTEEAFREFLDDRVAAALDALDPSFREVIVLSVVGELTYREIAEVLDCPFGTVLSRMARARRSLRERLADYAASNRMVGRPKHDL
jgi:RNA polymerase sigma-70 factor (ECF subfamily)